MKIETLNYDLTVCANEFVSSVEGARDPGLSLRENRYARWKFFDPDVAKFEESFVNAFQAAYGKGWKNRVEPSQAAIIASAYADVTRHLNKKGFVRAGRDFFIKEYRWRERMLASGGNSAKLKSKLLFLWRATTSYGTSPLRWGGAGLLMVAIFALIYTLIFYCNQGESSFGLSELLKGLGNSFELFSNSESPRNLFDHPVAIGFGCAQKLLSLIYWGLGLSLLYSASPNLGRILAR